MLFGLDQKGGAQGRQRSDSSYGHVGCLGEHGPELKDVKMVDVPEEEEVFILDELDSRAIEPEP